MSDSYFDRFTRSLAQRANRRGAVKTLAAGAIVGAGLVEGTTPALAADGEEWVQLYESLAERVSGITGHCDEVRHAIEAFHAEFETEIAEMTAELAAWSSEQNAAHRDAYAERIQQASVKIHLAGHRCGFVENSDSALCTADFYDNDALATPEAAVSDGREVARLLPAGTINNYGCGNDCECACDKVFTVGNCFLWTAACFFGGCTSGPNCCWWGICVGGFDHQLCVSQCGNCQNMQVNC